MAEKNSCSVANKKKPSQINKTNSSYTNTKNQQPKSKTAYSHFVNLSKISHWRIEKNKFSRQPWVAVLCFKQVLSDLIYCGTCYIRMNLSLINGLKLLAKYLKLQYSMQNPAKNYDMRKIFGNCPVFYLKVLSLYI